MRLPALVLVAALLGSVTVAPGARAAETPIATISDGPITIDVLRAPIADRPAPSRVLPSTIHGDSTQLSLAARPNPQTVTTVTATSFSQSRA